MTAIEFKDAGFTYDRERFVLRGLNLTVQPGEFVCVLGGNGSGKSTLAKHVNALLLPDEGRVEVLGRDTSAPDELFFIRSHAGMVFQNPDDQLVASLIENDVAFGPENLGVPADELRERVTEALARVGLQGFERRETGALSGGQKQRVAIAGVLAMEPEVLVLDEASAMLDPRGRAGLMRTVRELHEAGMTIVMITHFMEEAAEADRVVVLDEGRVVLDGTPGEVLSRQETLEGMSLDVPFAVKLSRSLQQAGLDVPTCVKEDQLLKCLIGGDAEGEPKHKAASKSTPPEGDAEGEPKGKAASMSAPLGGDAEGEPEYPPTPHKPQLDEPNQGQASGADEPGGTIAHQAPAPAVFCGDVANTNPGSAAQPRVGFSQSENPQYEVNEHQRSARGENAQWAFSTSSDSVSPQNTAGAAPQGSSAPEAVPQVESPKLIEFEHASFTYHKSQTKKKRPKTQQKADKPDWGNDPDELWALRDVSFTLRQGEFLGIAGHTGSGKSTLIQHMNGLLHPTEGRVLVRGADISRAADAAKARAEVGLVFQYPEHQLFAESVYEDVAFGPRNLGLPEEEVQKRYEHAMGIVDLDAHALRKASPFELSGGQQRRVAFAGVLAMNPSTLILDEPVAGLDPKAREDFLQLIERLHAQEGLTVVMVSHAMDDLARLSDRILMVERGRIVRAGAPEEVFSDAAACKAIGLGQPAPTRVAQALQAAGASLPQPHGLYELDSLTAAIAAWKRGE